MVLKTLSKADMYTTPRMTCSTDVENGEITDDISTTSSYTIAGGESEGCTDYEQDVCSRIKVENVSDMLGPLPLYLLDFQGFQGLDNVFIVKEMAMLERADEHYVASLHYFFMSPYSDTLLRQCKQLTANTGEKHQLRWTGNGAGQKHLNYSMLQPIVCNIVQRWLANSKQQRIKIYIYGYEQINLLDNLLNPLADEKQRLEYIDLTSPYNFCKLPNLEGLIQASAGNGVYCPEHYLLNYMETVRRRLVGNTESERQCIMYTPPYCALNIVNITHAWIMKTLFKNKSLCHKLFEDDDDNGDL